MSTLSQKAPSAASGTPFGDGAVSPSWSHHVRLALAFLSTAAGLLANLEIIRALFLSAMRDKYPLSRMGYTPKTLIISTCYANQLDAAGGLHD
jgi:hypothetical protein